MLHSRKHNIPVTAFSFGLASIVGQIALLREFMSLFSGHEIIIGVFLSFWMLMVGAGAFTVGRIKRNINVSWLPAIMGFALIAGLFTLYFSRAGMVVYGTEPEFSTLVLIIFISLLPVCLVTGYAFTVFSKEAASVLSAWSISNVYVWEQVGSSVGGGILYLILVQWLNSVQIITFTVFYLFIVAAWLSDIMAFGRKVTVIMLVVISGILILMSPLQKYLRGLDLRSEKIISIEDTPYGNVLVTESDGQKNIYENGDLRSYSGEIETTEEDVHAIMLRSPLTHKVLMIGGASSGTFREFEKYKDVKVDYVDIDPAIIEILRKYGGKGVRFFMTDPLRFLKRSTGKYDVVILDTGLPHNLQDNRFFTKEFFRLVKDHLVRSGVFGLKGPEKQFHKEDTYVGFLSVIASTGLSVFKKYDIYPGSHIFFLFTDGDILPLFAPEYTDVVKGNAWFNSDYILPDLSEGERLSYLKEIKTNMRINTSLNPVLLEESIVAKSGYWHIDRFTYIYVVAGLFLIVFLIFNRRSKTMALAGFALSGIQLILIYMMQIVAGNLYEVIGVLFGLSMAGMASGAWINRRYVSSLAVNSEIILLIIGIMILLLPFLLRFLVEGDVNFIFQVSLIYLLVLIFAFTGGVLFSSVSYTGNGDVGKLAGNIYGADLIGSSAGVLLASLFFIPVAGMVNTSFIFGIICLIFALFFLTGKL